MIKIMAVMVGILSMPMNGSIIITSLMRLARLILLLEELMGLDAQLKLSVKIVCQIVDVGLNKDPKSIALSNLEWLRVKLQ
jgi:hypothetical protein